MPTNLVFLGTHFVIRKCELSSYVDNVVLTMISTVYAKLLLASLNTQQELHDMWSWNTKSTQGNITFLSALGMRPGTVPGNVGLLSFPLKCSLGDTPFLGSIT